MRRAVCATLITLVLVLTCGVVAGAQTTTRSGIKATIGSANFTGDISGTKSMMSFGGGAVLRFEMSPQFNLQPEILVTLKGAADNDPSATKLKLLYVEVPVLAMYQPPTTGTVRPAFFAGPEMGILVSAKYGGFDVKDAMKTADFGLVFGAGLDFNLASGGIFALDGRYSMGMANTVKNSSGASVKNGVISLGVSYLFPTSH